jgi:O-succinylbenzoate synthase
LWTRLKLSHYRKFAVRLMDDVVEGSIVEVFDGGVPDVKLEAKINDAWSSLAKRGTVTLQPHGDEAKKLGS